MRVMINPRSKVPSRERGRCELQHLRPIAGLLLENFGTQNANPLAAPLVG